MITHLRGTLWDINHDTVIIDVNGVGYEVYVHHRVSKNYPQKGMDIHLYTYQQVLENDIRLFGFNNRNEVFLFKKLLNVTGMGTKNAINILSSLDPADFYQAILYEDIKTITNIPGIGKKTADRLIFELKSKFADTIPERSLLSEQRLDTHAILEALEALGYNRREVYPLMLELEQKGLFSDSLQDNIRCILQHKGQRR